MCIAAWVWQAHPVYQLLLLSNRDEYHDRPAKPLGWWEEGNKKILGGRDELAGGTWLGCTEDGRLAFLTNVREPDQLPGARTRGDLPLRFLKDTKSRPWPWGILKLASKNDSPNGELRVCLNLEMKMQ